MDRRQRSIRTALLAIALFALTAANALAGTPPQATFIAAQVAGKPVTVTCTTWDTWNPPAPLDPKKTAGYAQIGGTEMTLRPDACQGLQLLLDDPTGIKPPLPFIGPEAYDGGDPTEWEARAWGYVLHEAQHLRGVADETDTECAMLNGLPAVLLQLGVPTTRLDLLVRFAWAAHDARPPVYTSHPCPGRPAGQLPPLATAPPPPETPSTPTEPTGPTTPPASGSTQDPVTSQGSTPPSQDVTPAATTTPAEPTPPVQTPPTQPPAAAKPPARQTTIDAGPRSGKPVWRLTRTHGPLAPQTIPYLTLGLAAPSALGADLRP